jgi:uracil-DNA glycosylase family protein
MARATKAAASLDRIRAEARECTRCPLYKVGTQTVFGEGPVPAPVLMVGEQPGDREDLDGRPFVGPAGRLLDQALEDAGVVRAQVYVTNAVKHFKWEPRGKRRLHKKPVEREIAACHPWLLQEIAHVQPRLIVCLGATAAQALLGRTFRVTQQRGQIITHAEHGAILATWHPSALLRMPNREAREKAKQEFAEDLRRVSEFIRRGPAAPRATSTSRATQSGVRSPLR